MKPWHLLSSLLAIGFAAFAVWAGAELYESVLGYSWPETTGRIVTSEVQSKKMSRWRSYITYWPEIRYEYTRNGKPVVGDRIWFTASGSGKEASLSIVAKYPVGKVVPVFVDPDDEYAAVLEKGVPWLLAVLLPASLLLTASLVLLVYVDVCSKHTNIGHNKRFHGAASLTRRRP